MPLLLLLLADQIRGALIRMLHQQAVAMVVTLCDGLE